MNTWILDTAIARLLSTNAVVLTEPPNSGMVGKPYLGITSRLPVIRVRSIDPARLSSQKSDSWRVR